MTKKRDLIGEIHNGIEIIADAPNRGKERAVLCRCHCGREWVTLHQNLRKGLVKSCGCRQYIKDNLYDGVEIGKRFGELVVTEHLGNKKGHTVVLCKCDCGKDKETRRSTLLAGKKFSCGHSYAVRGGKSDTRLYNIWQSMNYRVRGNTELDSLNYKGRGVTVCEEWKIENPDGFKNFEVWATTVGGYRPGLELDKEALDQRNKIYCPEMCRFNPRHINQARKRKPVTGKTSKYIGVCLVKERNIFIAVVAYKGKKIFKFEHSSDHAAAAARERFILANNLPHTLNFIEETPGGSTDA